MFNWKIFERFKVIFSQEQSYEDRIGQHHVTIRPVDLIRWVELASEDLGFLTLVDMAGVDLSEKGDAPYRFELSYHLLNMGTHQRLNLHVVFNEGELIPSVIKNFSHADWLEREQSELLGIIFDRKMEKLLLPKNQSNFPFRKEKISSFWPVDPQETLPEINKNPNKSEAPYEEEAYVWKDYDLFSPVSANLFEWMVCYDPAKIVDLKTNIGFNHQGLEKILERKDWIQGLQLVDKIHIGAAPTYSIAWAKTIEDVLRIKLPERAQAIRIVVLELARIAEHLTVMHEMAFALKFVEHRLFINLREKIYELMEKYCGKRQGLGISKIGGVSEDLPHGWIVEYQNVSDIFEKTLKTIHRYLISRNTFRDVLEGAVVSAQTALEWGVSGPAMRAAGLNFDLRKSQPFYFYQDIDFDIPVGINGTSYERYLIRYEEIFQSFRIITQVIDNLPLGITTSAEYDVPYPKLLEVMQFSGLPDGWHYTSIESPNGEAGFMIRFDQSHFPYRVKMKTPGISLTQALPHFLKGVEESQLKASLISMGIRPFELDR